MSKISLTIDGKQYKVSSGSTVLEAAKEAGVYIPTLCYHPYLTPYGGCRMCIVEIEGMRGFPTACTTPAGDGMVVNTNTPQLQDLRRGFLDFILSKHPSACLVCDRKGECDPYRATIRKVGVTTGCQFCPNNNQCELQDVVEYVGLKELRIPNKYRELPTDTRDPFFERDYNLCILCGRCVRICQEVRGMGAIAFTYRSNQALVGTAFGQSLLEAGCRFCGACVDICPTGALSDRRAKWEGIAERTVTTTCPYCDVGCQLEIKVKEDRLTGITPADGVNKGQACVRGRFGIQEIVNHLKRLKVPTIKSEGVQAEASWNEALSIVAEKLGSYKPGEIAVINCSESTNEENYVIQKFARSVLKTGNIDSFARLGNSATITGLSASLGIGAATNSLSEITKAGCILTLGIDTGSSQPVAGVEIRRAVNAGVKLIAAGSRATDLSRVADIWLQYRPGTDIALLGGIMKVILDEGLADTDFIKKHCRDYDAFRKSLDGLSLAYVEKTTGVPRDRIIEAARIYAGSKTSCVIYGEGITCQSHGSDSVSAVANLALLTGNIGKPAAGIIPMTGMNNAQGVCDMGVMPGQKSGLGLAGILDAIKKKTIKACYVIGDHPLLHGKLDGLEFLVVQDILPSPTSLIADVVLPMASFVETEGTFTNAERRVQLVRKAIPPYGSSRPSWQIISQVAAKMGSKEAFDYKRPAQIMKEMNDVVPTYGGISYRRLGKNGIQWPCESAQSKGTPYLYKDAGGSKARFVALNVKSTVPKANAEYPLTLTGEPNLYYFHAGENLGAFSVLAGKKVVSINYEDAAAAKIGEGETVRIISKWGETEARAKIENSLPTGVIGMPLHLAYDIMSPATDKISGAPEYVVCPVKIEKKSGKGKKKSAGKK
jgi:formate dehydrogenase alpha subunit